ncbi:hypothetical protein CYLTODRAFT_383743 [Cylindrobasidium torrendii FP15055 ss-10]|uniref:Uncharacterized protein n=1 Tax=Cylindrobasidium torrendii FP15055 ss-10 TaxID=1314674 RepID=A0A0D7AVD7_9AGAR|nr:hypothetical protein CYLTODRAFT_383743 [Cylindrobasidium torrendii FP15055 ss-10]
MIATVSSLSLWSTILLLTKVTLVASETIGMKVSTTPPNPPPKKEHQLAPSLRETFVRQLMVGGPLFMRTAYLIGGIGEILALIAYTAPQWEYTPAILRIISFSPAFSPDLLYHNPLSILGTLLVIIGSMLRWWCYRVLGQHFTFELSVLKDHKLITRGPYGTVRHPSYTGGLLTVFGAMLSRGCHGSWLRESGVLGTWWGASITAVWIFLACGMGIGASARVKEEDRFLKREFGDKWDEWASQVRYRLIPGVL